MRTLQTTTQFRKDLKRLKKSGKNPEKLWSLLEALVNEKELSQKHRPHNLSGNWGGYWACHIEPDWLLIYTYTDNDTLVLVRTGSHAQLFK